MKFDLVIVFKSTKDNYKKESSYAKRNTVRIVDESEDIDINACKNELKYIEIVNTKTGDTILRKLTDITRFVNEGTVIYIFSW